MKKLYYLDESEKERILVMHKKHKENLIIEQAPYKIKENSGVWTEQAKNEFIADLNSFENITYRTNFTTKIINFCKTNYDEKFPNGPSSDLSTLQSITDTISSAAKSGAYSFSLLSKGRGMTDDAIKTFNQQLQKFANMANVCYSVKNLYTRGNTVSGYENIFDTFDEIRVNDGPSGYRNNILEILKYLSEQTKIYTPTQTTGQAANKQAWDNYLCVKNQGWEAKDAGDGTIYYKVPTENQYYYSNGAMLNTNTNKVIEYECKNNYPLQKGKKEWNTMMEYVNEKYLNLQPSKTQTTSAAAGSAGGGGGGYQQVAGGYIMQNAFTPQKVSTIKQAIGSADNSGTLTQDDINKLYAKLSQK